MDFNLFAHVFEIVAIIFLLMKDVRFTDVVNAQLNLNGAFQEYMEKINDVLESQSEVNKTQEGINKVSVRLFQAQNGGTN